VCVSNLLCVHAMYNTFRALNMHKYTYFIVVSGDFPFMHCSYSTLLPVLSGVHQEVSLDHTLFLSICHSHALSFAVYTNYFFELLKFSSFATLSDCMHGLTTHYFNTYRTYITIYFSIKCLLTVYEKVYLIIKCPLVGP